MSRDLANLKDHINSLLDTITRPGIDRLKKYINEETDFFVAPASTRFHGNYIGGLVEHSLNVYEIFRKKNDEYDFGLSQDSVIIVSLLHDLCKVNFYVEDKRNTKKDGKWVQVPYYKVEDKVPLGHGEKSVFLLSQFIRLSLEEIAIIRWHMGGYEAKEHYNYISEAWNIFRAGVCLHTADLEASYILEKHVEY